MFYLANDIQKTYGLWLKGTPVIVLNKDRNDHYSIWVEINKVKLKIGISEITDKA